MSFSAPDIWFPLTGNVSSSSPQKIALADMRTPRSSRVSPDAMEGIFGPPPQSLRSGHTRPATRAIPNRTSRSNSLSSVPATPTSLWRQVSSDPTGQDLTRELVGSEKCPHTTLNPERVRSFPSLYKVPVAASSSRKGPACYETLLPPPALSPINTIPPNVSTSLVPSVLTQWAQNDRTFLRLWSAEKHKNPYLPRVVSPPNPLRALMPPMYWQSVNTTRNRSLQKVEWNFRRPLPSPALPTKLRSRKQCDAAGERLSSKAVYAGKLRRHCRVCSQDTLLKQLLLVRHWASRADAIFECALSLIHADDDCEMGDATLDDCFPETVLRDRDDFDDDDRSMDDAPLIVDRHSDCYPLRLF